MSEVACDKAIFQPLPGRTVIIDSSEMQEPTRLDEVTVFSGALVQCFEFSGAPSFCFAKGGSSGYHSASGALSFSSSRQLVQARSSSALISPPIRNDNPETYSHANRIITAPSEPYLVLYVL